MPVQHGASTNPIFNDNKLKVAAFCTNNMTFLTNLAKDWEPSWEKCLAAARIADTAGFEALVPMTRWKGYMDGRPGHSSHQVLDPFIYAAGIAQATSHSAVFATAIASTMHPIVVAKQAATIDLISNGRFALNIVGGWNRREFEMFGIDLIKRELRYGYLDEWTEILERLWSSDQEFDFKGEYLEIQKGISRPQPVQKPVVPMMNAAHSEEGKRFAASHCDIALISGLGASPEEMKAQIFAYKDMARREFGRELLIFTNAVLVLRDSEREAREFVRLYSEEQLDEEALDSFTETLASETTINKASPQYQMMRSRVAIGSGFPLVGDAESITRQLETFASAGLDGVLLNCLDFVDGLARFSREVMPRLEQLNLRRPFRSAPAAALNADAHQMAQ